MIRKWCGAVRGAEATVKPERRLHQQGTRLLQAEVKVKGVGGWGGRRVFGVNDSGDYCPHKANTLLLL